MLKFKRKIKEIEKYMKFLKKEKFSGHIFIKNAFHWCFFLKSSICVHIPSMKYNQGQNHLETNFAETNFPKCENTYVFEHSDWLK